MNMDKTNRDFARNFLNEYHDLETALNLLEHHDVRANVTLGAIVDANGKCLKEASFKVTSEGLAFLKAYIESRMQIISDELAKM